MSSKLLREFYNVQNPALGAYLLSNFTVGYKNENQCLVPLPLIFIVLPMVLRNEIVDFISSTNRKSGLRYFAEKFTEKKYLKNDLLIQIQKQSQSYKVLTMESLRLAIAQNLIILEDKTYLMPIEGNIKKFKSNSDELKKMAKAAEKLGAWCAQLSLAEVAQILKVRF